MIHIFSWHRRSINRTWAYLSELNDRITPELNDVPQQSACGLARLNNSSAAPTVHRPFAERWAWIDIALSQRNVSW